MTATLLALVSVSRVSVWAALAIMMREFVVMALRGLVAVSGGLIKPSMWGKIKTTAQFTANRHGYFAIARAVGTALSRPVGDVGGGDPYHRLGLAVSDRLLEHNYLGGIPSVNGLGSRS